MSIKSLLKIVLLAAVAVASYFGFLKWKASQVTLPEGIASGNGRIEAKLVDVAAMDSLRVKEILVDEGALVKPGEVLVRLDTSTLGSQLAEAKANVAAAEENAAVKKSTVVKSKSEVDLADVEYGRAKKLFDQKAGSKEDLDRRDAQLKISRASLEEAEAGLRTAKQQIEVAQNNVATIQTKIDDATLTSPVRGRVLYRLAEVGEVLAPGGKALTLVNLEDIYMEIFLPSEDAAHLKVGDEARLTVDHAPGRAAKGHVSFVSPKAQFTPKQVETRSERDKLMFRVKVQVPEELVTAYIERIKTGVRGVAYVKVAESAVWPDWLQNLVVPENAAHGEEGDRSAVSDSRTDSSTNARETAPVADPAKQ